MASDYEKLEQEFEKKVSTLQKECLHKKSTWCQEWYRIAASTGRQLLKCDNCNKILETKGKKFWDKDNE